MELLAGRKALVLGVANKMSLAWAIARAFREHGAQVALSCLESSRRKVEKLATSWNCGPVLVCDLRRDEDVVRLFQDVGRHFEGTLDILVHSVAYADLNFLGGEFIKTPRAAWNEALEISAYSLVACVREARTLLKASGHGSVITLTYAGSQEVVPGYNIMGVAKAALECSVRYLAYDLGPENIRVNALSPGPVRTISALAVQNFELGLRMAQEHAPMLRNITAEEVGAAAVFLASNLAAPLTGCVLPVDAGLHILSRPSIARSDLKL